VLALVAVLGLLSAVAPAAGATAEFPFVGGATCAECHAEEARLWRGSHHDLAMQVPDERSVLGDFASGATLTYGDVTSTFYTRDGKYLVHTDGPDGKLHEYEVAYTFGADPLQQYLVALPGGRYQALPLAWDARPASEGGQRWFHLYPGENVTHEDVLHWTRPAQNWNAQCARCHSTNLRKGFDFEARRYATTWAEIDVSCEACHGPGGDHVSRARAGEPPERVRAALPVRLGDARTWAFDGVRPIARRSDGSRTDAELETCAPCHARRAELSADALPGRPLLDDYLPALLTEDLYFADGQMRGEVYEYGSFVQSAMYRAGVTCSDCHEPHGAKLRAEGNALCGRCHLSSHFDDPKHHFHPAGSAGAQCVACHMPARTYMGVDERHNHGFRIPRPALSARVGAPDTCTSCHRDRSQAWAAEEIARRSPQRSANEPYLPDALAAARRDQIGSGAALVRAAGDAEVPAIARATALSMLRDTRSPEATDVVRKAATDADPLVRAAAVAVAPAHGPRAAVEIAAPRLADERRAVRFAAASALLDVPEAAFDAAQRTARDRALEEYRVSQAADADRAQAHVNLAAVALGRWRPSEAERELRGALRLDPDHVPAYVNLVDLLRAQRRDVEGEKLLRDALGRLPRSAELHHALGLLLARQKRSEDAVAELEQAARLAPDSSHYAYVFGVALHSVGHPARALEVLRDAQRRHPGDADLLLALATMLRDAGDRAAARDYAAKLTEAAPWDERGAQLSAQLAATDDAPPSPASR